ncbi:Protein of unknown function [Sphingobium faniae]|nr:Protein of unknown function [Sphingobium faniae]
MKNLSDLQCILLSTAAQRDDGSIHPLPANVDPRGGAKAIGGLMRRGLVQEREGDGASPSLHINNAGLTAIGIEPETDDEKNVAADSAPAASSPSRTTKANLLLSMLQRPGGAVMAELTDTTGWLPHTVRAALTGLRKKGNIIDRGTRDGKACYRIGTGH